MSGVRRKSRNRSNSRINIHVIEQANQRVLTIAQLAESYGADNKRISNNFNENKVRYTEGKHFYALEGGEKRDFINRHEIRDGSKKRQNTLPLDRKRPLDVKQEVET